MDLTRDRVMTVEVLTKSWRTPVVFLSEFTIGLFTLGVITIRSSHPTEALGCESFVTFQAAVALFAALSTIFLCTPKTTSGTFF